MIIDKSCLISLFRFGTLFSESEGLSVAMEEGHNLVMIGAGTQCV